MASVVASSSSNLSVASASNPTTPFHTPPSSPSKPFTSIQTPPSLSPRRILGTPTAAAAASLARAPRTSTVIEEPLSPTGFGISTPFIQKAKLSSSPPAPTSEQIVLDDAQTFVATLELLPPSPSLSFRALPSAQLALLPDVQILTPPTPSRTTVPTLTPSPSSPPSVPPSSFHSPDHHRQTSHANSLKAIRDNDSHVHELFRRASLGKVNAEIPKEDIRDSEHPQPLLQERRQSLPLVSPIRTLSLPGLVAARKKVEFNSPFEKKVADNNGKSKEVAAATVGDTSDRKDEEAVLEKGHSDLEWAENFWCEIASASMSSETGEDVFFANPASGKLVWTPPEGVFVLPLDREYGQWWQCSDYNRDGLCYFYHTKTQETRWTRPPASSLRKGEFIIPLNIIQLAALKASPNPASSPKLPSATPATPSRRKSVGGGILFSPSTAPASPTKQSHPTRSRSQTRRSSVYRATSQSDLNAKLKADYFRTAQGGSTSEFGLVRHYDGAVTSPVRGRRGSSHNNSIRAPFLTKQHSRSNEVLNLPDLASNTRIASTTVPDGYNSAANSEKRLKPEAPEMMLDSSQNSSTTSSGPPITPGIERLSFGFFSLPRWSSKKVSVYSPNAPSKEEVPVVIEGLPPTSSTLTPDATTRQPKLSMTLTENLNGPAAGDKHKLDLNGLKGLKSGQSRMPESPASSKGKISLQSISKPMEDLHAKRSMDQLGSSSADSSPQKTSRRSSVLALVPSTPPPKTPSHAIQLRLTNRLSSGSHPVLPPEIQEDIQKFAFPEYAQQFFSRKHKSNSRFGLMRRRRVVPLESMMEFQVIPITDALLEVNLEAAAKEKAIKFFKVIQHVMGDRMKPVDLKRIRSGGAGPRASTPSVFGQGNAIALMQEAGELGEGGEERVLMLKEITWMLGEAISARELMDEVYCQIIKQLTNNPSPASVFRGWELLCAVTWTGPPTNALLKYVQSFVRNHTSVSENKIDVMAKHCLPKLLYPKPSKGKTPRLMEIESAMSAPFNPTVFGQPLSGIMDRQAGVKDCEGLTVPVVIIVLAEGILALQGASTEGLFRVPGDADDVALLRNRIERGDYRVDDQRDPNVLCSLYKEWIRELSPAIIPENMYNDALEASEDPAACCEFVKKLPPINRRVLIWTISFLHYLLKSSDRTKMDSNAFATVFAPNLLRAPPSRYNSSDIASIQASFLQAKFEIKFVLGLLLKLDPAEFGDEGFKPTYRGRSVRPVSLTPTKQAVQGVLYRSTNF